MERAGVEVAITSVGDRYVLEELRARGWTLGGEQSGHIIEMGFNRTGDGIAERAAHARGARRRATWPSATRCSKLPQRLVNVRVRDRDALAGADAVHAAVRAAEQELAGPRARARAPERHRAARAGDGRGAHRRGGRRGLRAARRARRARARRLGRLPPAVEPRAVGQHERSAREASRVGGGPRPLPPRSRASRLTEPPRDPPAARRSGGAAVGRPLSSASIRSSSAASSPALPRKAGPVESLSRRSSLARPRAYSA